MKKANVLLVTIMVLLLACGSAFAFGFSTADDTNGGQEGTQVPEPATVLLLGTGIAGLAIAARKNKK